MGEADPIFRGELTYSGFHPVCLTCDGALCYIDSPEDSKVGWFCFVCDEFCNNFETLRYFTFNEGERPWEKSDG